MNITGSGPNVGGIAGRSNKGTIQNCINNGSIIGEYNCRRYCRNK